MRLSRCWIAISLLAAAVSCTKLDLSGNGPVPTPSSSASSSPIPGVCGTPSANANVVEVAMGNNISATYTSKYGIINGYAVIESGRFPYTAEVIDQWVNGSGNAGPITSKNLLQFANVDGSGVQHSAVGFKGDAFPSVPYTFPIAAASPQATAVSTTTLWSTGRVDAGISEQCYSQTFSLKVGTYYFGDLDYYNLSNFRDVLVVASPTP